MMESSPRFDVPTMPWAEIQSPKSTYCLNKSSASPSVACESMSWMESCAFSHMDTKQSLPVLRMCITRPQTVTGRDALVVCGAVPVQVAAGGTGWVGLVACVGVGVFKSGEVV